jgi:RNA polymerase sigma-70 factor (sigma-E family)
MTPAGPEETAERPNKATENLVTNRGIMPDAFLASSKVGPESSAGSVVSELYSVHFQALVRLAELLVWDRPTAEEVVQDAFVAMHGSWQQLRDTEKALGYLRQAVVNRSRSVLRHRTVVDKNLQETPPDMPSAEHEALALLERQAVVVALRGLPDRQREVIVLRYYADLSEAETASVMGVSRGAVKSHLARGMAALRVVLENYQAKLNSPDMRLRRESQIVPGSMESSQSTLENSQTNEPRETLWATLDRRPHVLDQHVGAVGQAPEHLAPGGGLQVQGQRPLVPVQLLEVAAVPAAAERLPRARLAGRLPPARGTGAAISARAHPRPAVVTVIRRLCAGM